MTETRNYYTRNYVDHSTFGGIICDFDFSGHHTMASMVDRIIQDQRFDERCRRNVTARDRQKKYRETEDVNAV